MRAPRPSSGPTIDRMMRRASVLSVVLLVAGSLAPAGASGRVTLEADKQRYVPGEAISITLINATQRRHTFRNPWLLKRGDDVVAKRRFPDRVLRPGESITWSIVRPQCPPDQEQPCPGESPWRAGRYRAIVRTSAGKLVDRFLLGNYYTLGFRNFDTEFTVFVARQKAMDLIDAELEEAEDERNLIVSGIVRGKRPYNPTWSYTMAPLSIVAGEVFIEVCDASPHYVEENLDDWRGDRWCPWDSYPRRVGR